MARNARRNDLRSHLAYLAARIMVEDGIEDYSLAKRKAARQAGAGEGRQLPDNQEIDAARASLQQIFHTDEQPAQLAALRETAAHAMRELAAFDPHLTGAVLHGTAGKYAAVQLQLFTDDATRVELFLLGRGIEFSAGQSVLYSGETRVTAPTYALYDDDDTEIQLTVLSRRELRATLKTSPAGKPMERARLPEVEILLAGA
jgi:hypothetical protein